MCKNCFISILATYFSVYFLLIAIKEPRWDIWMNSLIITVLVLIAVMACPILNKEGWKCCTGKKAKKKK